MGLTLRNTDLVTNGTIPFVVNDITDTDFNFNGIRLLTTKTLTGNLNITITGTPYPNQILTIINEGSVITNGNTFYIQGIVIPSEIALKKFTAILTYNGGTWIVNLNPDFTETSIIDTDRIKELAITNDKVNDVDGSKIAAASIPASKMVAHTLTANEIAAGTITATEIANTTITGSKLVAATIPLTKLATQADSTVLGNNSGGVAVPTVLSKTDLRSIISYVAPQTVLTVPVSFETGEQADNTITIPFACTLDDTYVSAYATHAIAATNNATITLEKNGVAITGGLITFTASAAINTAGTVTAFSPVTFAAGDTLNLVSAKVTAGGKAIVSIPLVLI